MNRILKKLIYISLISINLFLIVNTTQAQYSKPPLKQVDILISPNKADWKYDLNEKASVDIQVLQYNIAVPNVEIEYQYGREIVGLYEKGSLQLKNGKGKLNLGSLIKPGFLQLKVSTTVNGYTYKNEVKLAYAPEQIEPTVTLPDDFNEFWSEAIAKNKELPMDAKLMYMPEYSTGSVNVYLVSFQNYKKGKRIYGYLCKPKKEGIYPVLFTPPGAGIKKIEPYTKYAEAGFISLSIEIHGISPELSKSDYNNIKNAFNEYWFINLDDKENYYYKSVYLACVRSIDFLCALPEFDGKNVVVTGGSQGGALTMVTAGIDQRVTAIAAFYPALCDVSAYLNGRVGGWPHMFAPKYQKINNTPEKIETMRYYDVVNFAKNIQVPGFYSFGYNDHICPPTSVYAAVNVIEAPKEIVVTPISGHWRFNESNDKAMQFLLKHCGL